MKAFYPDRTPRAGIIQNAVDRRIVEAEAARLGVTLAEYLALRCAGKLPAPEPVTPPVAAAGAALSLLELEVLDQEGMLRHNPALRSGTVVRLASPSTSPIVVGTLARLLPTDAGRAAVDMPGSFYDALLDAVGGKPCAEPREDYVDEARQWAGMALAMTPSGPIEVWRHEDRARRMMVADRLARSFLLPPATAEQIAGAPPPRLTLWAGQDAARLDEAKAAREAARAEEEARAKAEAERARVEAAKVRSPREAGCFVLELKKHFSPPPELAPLMAWPSWTSDGSKFLLLPEVEGMPMPPVDGELYRVCDPDEQFIPPGMTSPGAPPRDLPSGQWRTLPLEVYQFVVAAITQYRGGVPHGPVKEYVAVPEPHELALLEELGRFLHQAAQHNPREVWRTWWAVTLLVKGRALRPDVCAEHLWSAVERAHGATRQEYVVPTSGPVAGSKHVHHPGTKHTRFEMRHQIPLGPLPRGVSRGEIEECCVGATTNVFVAPGCLRKPLATIVNTNHKKVRNGARAAE